MPKLEKSTDHSHKLITSEVGQDTSACKISGRTLHAFSCKCPGTSPDWRTDGPTDGHAVTRLRLVGWTNGPMYRSKEGISGFGRTDRQPENIMPPAPKGGGITNIRVGSDFPRRYAHVSTQSGPAECLINESKLPINLALQPVYMFHFCMWKCFWRHGIKKYLTF